MRIWVDADACPAAIKEILFRAAVRAQVVLTLVANKPMHTPPSRFIRRMQVAAGFDMADDRIACEVRDGDLVITADIPLAARVIERGAHVLSPRGEPFDVDNIRERLSMRDFMSGLRESGVQTGGPAALSQADRQAFANHLDRFLAHRV